MRKQKILDNFLLSVTLIHLYKLHGHWFQFVNNLSPINFMYVLSFFFFGQRAEKKNRLHITILLFGYVALIPRYAR